MRPPALGMDPNPRFRTPSSRAEEVARIAGMQTIQDLLDGYRRFRLGRYGEQAQLYEKLARGQAPKIMLIGCVDSRADPSEIFATAPGELFTVRNVANLVPKYGTEGNLSGVGTALEFAVQNLGIRHIVVMGHGQCGGVHACLQGAESAGGFLGPWVAQLVGLREEVLAKQPSDAQYAMELAGVRHSLANLVTYPFVKQALDQGSLELHGAWFSIGEGELSWLAEPAGEFEIISH